MLTDDAATREDLAEDADAIRRVVAEFGEAWNRHDAAALVRDFAEDLDHVSVRGRWQRSRAELEQTYIANHAGIWNDVTYHPVVEAIRFLRPDVAVAIVHGTFRSSGAEDTARATWILSKEGERWRCRTFHQTYLQDVAIAPRPSEQT